MINKESILRLLENEIDKLSFDYHTQINNLNKQIAELKEEIDRLNKENQSLHSNLSANAADDDYKRKYEILLNSIRSSDDIPYDLIDEWCVSSSIEDSISLLSTLNYVLVNGGKLEKAIYIIQLIQRNPEPLMHIDPTVKSLFNECLTNILVSRRLIPDDEDYVELYVSCLDLLLKLSTSELREHLFTELIRGNQYKILDNIFTLQSPEILTNFMRVCMHYHLKLEIPDILHELFEEKWEFVEGIFFKNYSIFLLWYTFLFDFDVQYIEKSVTALQQFNESASDADLYFYLYNSIRGTVLPKREDYQTKVQNFINGSVLTSLEKDRVLAKVDSIMEPLFANQLLIEKVTLSSSETAEIEAIRELTPLKRIERYLDILERYAKKHSFQHFGSILSSLHSDSDNFGRKDIKRLRFLLEYCFKTEYEDITELDQTYKHALALIQKFPDSNQVKIFLANCKNVMMEQVLDLNEPHIISELARTYSRFNLTGALNQYLNKVIDRWSFIDGNIDQQSFMRLFWIIFNQSLEQRLLKLLDESAAFLKSDIPETKIFSIYQDPKLDSLKKEALIEELKGKVDYFDEDEIKNVFQSLDKQIKKQAVKASTDRLRAEIGQKGKTRPNNSQPTTARKMMYVVQLPDENPVTLDTNDLLTEEWILLTLYKDVSLQHPSVSTIVKVLSKNGKGKAYVTPSLLNKIKLKIENEGFIDIRSYEKTFDKNNTERPFLWPSTNLTGNIPSDSPEKGQLNEESELKKLGYQITGLTRDRRWSILEKAVKQLGLKRVAYTIAQNVKLRKGQRNGETKFKYAISEWEYDLAKLKKQFYKSDFTWPTTKVNHS